MKIRVADWVKAIIVTGTIVLAFLVAGKVFNTIQIFAGALIIAYILTPLITYLEERKVHRYLAIAFAYVVFIAAIALALAVVVPLIVSQTRALSEGLPSYLKTLQELASKVSGLVEETGLSLYIDIDPQLLIGQAASIITEQLGKVISFIPSVLAFIIEGFLVLFISLYVLLAIPAMQRSIKGTLPDDETRVVYDDFNVTMRKDLNRYIVGLILVMITVGIMSGIAYWVIGIPYPLLLGIWAGITELVPYLGPALGVIPALIIALTVNPLTVVITLAVFLVIQTLENLAISPNILGAVGGLNPLVIILSLLAGAELGGILGLILAVPIVVFFSSLVAFTQQNFRYVRAKTGPDRITLRRGCPEERGPDS
ncbi:MAG: AI-2E family transporter [Actinomycetota bacterium]|nr:AI-2E family transporter [Actinomycetota bacterium]